MEIEFVLSRTLTEIDFIIAGNLNFEKEGELEKIREKIMEMVQNIKKEP